MASPPKPRELTALFAVAFIWTLFTLPMPSALKLSRRTLLMLEHSCPRLKKHPSAHHFIRGVSQDHRALHSPKACFLQILSHYLEAAEHPAKTVCPGQGEVGEAIPVHVLAGHLCQPHKTRLYQLHHWLGDLKKSPNTQSLSSTSKK